MNVSMDALRDTLKARNQAHAAAQQAEPAPRPAPEPPPEPTPEAASSSPADAATKPDASSDLINPMRWWDTLTQQFTHLAAQAAQPMAAAAAAKPKPASARKTAGSTAAKGARTTTKRKTTTRKPKPNEISCVLRISNGQASALLTGDIEAAQEWVLVTAGVLPVDVLLVPHHGSKTSSTLPFLQALQPRLALVQAGYRNRYGHPAQAVLDRYRAEDIALVESARCGAARWHSDVPTQVQCERALSKRYWHHVIALVVLTSPNIPNPKNKTTDV